MVLSRTLTAELWSRSGSTGGTLLAELKFTPAEPGTLVQQQSTQAACFVPLVLAPGDYTIVAHGYGAALSRPDNEGFGGPGIMSSKRSMMARVLFPLWAADWEPARELFPRIESKAASVNFYSAGTFPVQSGWLGQ